MGTAWEEKAGCDWGRLSNIHKETVLRWTAEYIIRIVWSSYRSCVCMCPMLPVGTVKAQPLQNRTTFIFLSKKYKNEWQRSQSSCVICIFSPTKVPAAHSCCWEAPEQHVKDGHKLQGCYLKPGTVGEWCRLSWERLLLASYIGLYLKNGPFLVAPENWNSAYGNSVFKEKEKYASHLLPAKGETWCYLGMCVLLCDSGPIRPGS